MKKITKKETQYGEVSFEFEVTYQEETSIEEGHGFHTFYDSEEISRKVTSVSILLDNGERINLTDKLNKEQMKLIIDSYV
jgi:hypothetical protein